MKIAVLFPGIGYTCDKPLMYYSGKLARELGYEVLPVSYGGFPRGMKDDPDKRRECFEAARAQAERQLAGVDWAACDDRLFIGKSIGTVIAAQLAKARGIAARQVLLTPLEEAFDWVEGDAVAFHGTADPWADTPRIAAACAARGIPLHLTDGANHSLETGRVDVDVATLGAVLRAIRAFVAPRP